MIDLSQIHTLEVIPTISPGFGGPAEVVINLTRELRALGIDAEIATTNDDMPGIMDVPLGEKVEYRQVPVYFFPRCPIRLKQFLFSADLTQWLWHNIKSYDLVTAHILFSYAPDLLMTLARFHQIPYGVRTIGQLTPWALSQGHFKKALYSHLIERTNLSNATFIHCTSPDEATDVTNFGITTPKVVIPLGVNPPTQILDAKQQLRQGFGIAADVPIVLFMSRIHPKKRLDLLIQVLGELNSPQQPFHLLIAGAGEDKYVESLHQLVAQHQLQSQTTFAGFVTGIDKDLLLQGADLFVLPSYSENFGIALAEAMVVGLPVITTPGVQIASDIAQAHAGLIVEDAVQLRLAIEQLLQSPQLRQELGANGSRLALQKYSWPAIAQQFADVYTLILDRKDIAPIYFPSNSCK
jgi:glycosyltransferase involved in cell wall biosynthesis